MQHFMHNTNAVIHHRKKTIRTLPTKVATPALKAAARTVPPPKVRKFTESSLSLKGTRRRKLGWERRPGT